VLDWNRFFERHAFLYLASKSFFISADGGCNGRHAKSFFTMAKRLGSFFTFGEAQLFGAQNVDLWPGPVLVSGDFQLREAGLFPRPSLMPSYHC
jgi:hypothetical protein